jgi:hypothetical protein
MDDRATFLASVAKVLPKTQRVLEFYKVFPNSSPAGLDFEHYVGALSGVCREYRKGFGGIDDLRKVLAAFELLRSHRFGGCTGQVIAAALDALTRHNAWLDSTFPEVWQAGSTMN